jgi:hypothetical protein
VMEATLLGRSDPGRAAEALEAMLNSYSQDAEKARLHYEIFRLTGREENREAALKIYEKLYGKTPKADFRDKISILKEKLR